jgi:1,5-anhydro-D-fructose reductase (1,5-anhydro-D-mannitol-forming)
MAARIAGAIRLADGAVLHAVSSRDPDKAASFAAEHEAARHYAALEDLLEDGDVDALYIATPNHLHAQQTLAALGAAKHVLIEKPMALTVSDAEAMVDRARAVGRLLGVGFHLRHHPVHREIKRVLDTGVLGELAFATSLWASYGPGLAQERDRWLMRPLLAGGGSIMGLGVHEVDLLRWLVGQEISEVIAMTDGPSEQYPVEFITAATLRFSGGVIAQLVSSRRLPSAANSLSIYGSAGRIDGTETLGMATTGELRIVRGTETTITRIPLQDAYLAEIEAFSRAAESGGPFEASGEDGARVVAATVAIAESAASGQLVRVADL